MDDLLDEFAAWSVRQELADIPAEVLVSAKQSLIDAIGVGIAGTRLPVSTRTFEWALSQYREGVAGILGRSDRLAPSAAAFANAVACHALDFDDTCYEGIVHASSVVLPAALAGCQVAGGGGTDLLLAYCVGCQVEVEIGRALTNDLYDRGWFNTALLGAFGAAAAAAKGLGLTAKQTRAALALAAMEARGIRAVLGTEAKPYLAGSAAETGVRCALLVRLGLTAPASVFDAAEGFSATHLGRRPKGGRLSVPFRWCFVDPGFALKLYPVCSAAQAAVEELLSIQQELRIASESIVRVHAAGTGLVARSLRHERPSTWQEAQFSMQFALASILRFGRLTPRELTNDALQDPRLVEFMSRISLSMDPLLDSRSDRDRQCPEGVRLSVETHSGERVTRVRLAASGMPQRPFSTFQLWEKFEHCCTCADLSAQASRQLFELLQVLEELRHLESIFEICGQLHRSDIVGS